MFKKLRFTIIWILAIALLVSFAGCSGNDSDEEENGPSSSANPVPEDLAGNITISAYKNYENDNDLFMFAQAYALQYPSVDVQIDADYSYDEYFATLDGRDRRRGADQLGAAAGICGKRVDPGPEQRCRGNHRLYICQL